MLSRIVLKSLRLKIPFTVRETNTIHLKNKGSKKRKRGVIVKKKFDRENRGGEGRKVNS